MNDNDFYINVMMTREEWDVFDATQKKQYIGRLSAIDSWLAQFLLECLEAHEEQAARENTICMKSTYDYYYGDES